MDNIVDRTFGELSFSYAWVSEIKIELFGKSYDVELIVEGNDGNEVIREEQRASYELLMNNYNSIIKSMERSLITYTESFLAEYGKSAESEEAIKNALEPTGLIFPIVLGDGDIQFGLLLESKFDPEHGVGVRYINGRYEASNQDILI